MVRRNALGDALSLIYHYWWLVLLPFAYFGDQTDHGFGETKRELVCRADDSDRNVVRMGFRPGMVGLSAE